jgi:hypothetical protein
VLAWQRGAIGEPETAKALAGLPSWFVVLHDRKIPRSSANIDHIVIGPPGVFVIETKRLSGRLTIRGDEVFVAGRRRTKIVEHARWEVTALLSIHRAELPWRIARVGGVAIVSGRGLTAALTKAPEVLAADEVECAVAVDVRPSYPAATLAWL